MVAFLGLTSAIIYGASDFLGGLASRRISSLLVSFLSTGVAMVLVVLVVLVERPVWSMAAVLLGALGGVLGAIGTWAFYASLALGPMSILSPGVAAIYALLPAIVGISLGERFSTLGWIALAAVIGAAVLLGVRRQGDALRVSGRAALLAVVAGVGYAGYIIAIHATPPESGLAPLAVDLLVATALFGLLLLGGRLRRGSAELAGLRDGRALNQSLLTGVALAVGNILLVIGLHLGDLAVMGVLSSLYPLGTVLLAFLVLRERLSWVQGAGIVLALAGSVLLASG
ncbi:DMT family transporter [Naasia sp.]|uniref:DMT family transporter n=1 Tax=Naasia sp. TaxID=2546198 RepID=UPI00262D7844|nr:DMT family transporter [Naasia sp.]